MSDQWKNRIVIVTTGILLFSFSIACLLKPSDEVSLSERRPLTQFHFAGYRQLALRKLYGKI